MTIPDARAAVDKEWEKLEKLLDATSRTVRGALLTRESDSSFAEAHMEFLSEPTHMEDEVND